MSKRNRESGSIGYRLLAATVGVVGCAVASAAPLDSLSGTWRCDVEGRSAALRWDEMQPADGCDGEVCRLTSAHPLQGTISAELGGQLALGTPRPHGKGGWTFTAMNGGVWHLRHTLDALKRTLKGTFSGRGKRQSVICRK